MIRSLAVLAALLLSLPAQAQTQGASFPYLSGAGGGGASGAAGGDLSGTYPNPTVSLITGLTPSAFATSTDAANLTGTVPGSVLAVTDTTKTGNYPVVSGDMGQALDLKGTGHTLTLSAKASGLWQPGHTLTINNTSSGNWTITNSSTLTLAGLNTSTIPPGTSGTFVANANGTHLDFFPGMQRPTATAIGGFVTPVPISDGGSGVTTIADDQIVVGTGADTTAVKTVPNCTDTGGNHLNYTQATNAFSCGTSGGGGGVTLTPSYKTATWYMPYGNTSQTANGSTNTAGSIYCVPGTVLQTLTIDTLGTQISTASAGGNLQLAVYSAGSWGRAETMLVNTASISTTSTGSVSSAASVQLTAGTYWFCSQHDNTSSATRGYNNASTSYGVAALAGSGTLSHVVSGGQISGHSTTGSFGTWPNFTSGTTWTDEQGGIRGPVVGFKVASVP